MDIDEINSIDVDNIKTNSLDVDNLETSDEKDIDEINEIESTNIYARNSRLKKIGKTATSVAILSVSFVAGGSSISNLLLGKNPVINNVKNCITIDGLSLDYNFDVTIEKLGLIFELSSNDKVDYTFSMKKTGIYEGHVDLVNNTTYNVDYYYSNFSDYRIKAYDLSYSFETKVEV